MKPIPFLPVAFRRRIAADVSAGRPAGVCVISALVTFSNAFLMFFYFTVPVLGSQALADRLMAVVSPTAVFPFDFFHTYVRDDVFLQRTWILAVLLCVLGILRLRKNPRSLFILLNVVHLVTLGYLVGMRVGRPDFLDAVFKLYFNLVASGAYIGYLTMPEVLEAFGIPVGGRRRLRWRWPRRKAATAWDYKNLGMAYVRLGRYEEAVESFRRASESAPEDVEAHFHLGRVHLQQGAYASAQQAFIRALAVDPLHPEALYGHGEACLRQGCAREAVVSLERALTLQPRREDIQRDLAQAYIQEGRFSEALQIWEGILKKNPRDAEAAFRIGLIERDENRRFEEARQAFDRAARLRPEWTQARFELGVTLMRMHRIKEALRAFREVVARKEDDARAHYHLGFCYASIGDRESARRHLEILQGLDPDLAAELDLAIASIT